MSFRRCVSVAAVALLAAVALSGGRAEAQTGSGVELVTDYANYPDTPQARLPAGCDGGGLFQSQQFSLNGGGAVSDPKLLPEFNAGDTLTMTWNANTPGCDGAPIVLVVKVAQRPVFSAEDNQEARVPYAMVIADGGPGSLSYVLPGLEQFERNCAYQLDAIVGLPLKTVGPSGSDYSAGIRSAPPINQPGSDNRTTLIAFRNGAYENCVAEVTTTTTSAPTTTTTAEAPTTSTSEAPTTTTAPPLEVFTPTTEAPTLGAVAVEAAGAQRTLAATGPSGLSSGEAAVMGVTALGSGVVLLVAARRRRSVEDRG